MTAPQLSYGVRAALYQPAQRSETGPPPEYSRELDLRADQAEAPSNRSAIDRSLPLPRHFLCP